MTIVNPSSAIRARSGNCTLVALRQVLDPAEWSDERILEHVDQYGWYTSRKRGEGLTWTAFWRVARGAGLKLTQPWASMDYHRVTLGQACREHFKTGTWLVNVRGHVLVVRDGIIIDPNYNMYGRAARRDCLPGRSYLVKNAYIPPTGTQYYVIRNPSAAKRQGTDSYARYKDMFYFLHRNPNASDEEIFHYTPYTRADMAYDLKAGHTGRR